MMISSISILAFSILLLCSPLPLLFKEVDCWPVNENVKQQKIEQDIAVKQIKACELDPECFGCWKSVDKQLLTKASNEFSACRLPSWMSVPFRNVEQDYCCQLWSTFDCRSEIASRHCTLAGYIKYRRNMIVWANSLMSNNICALFEYESEKCRPQQQKNFILDEFDDVRQFM